MELLLIFLAAGGLLLRLLSAGADLRPTPPVIRLVMLVLAAVGGWALATAAGWWAPWWPTLVVALGGTLASVFYAGRALRPALDASIVLWLGWLAVPAAAWMELVLLTAGYALLGMAADRMLHGTLPTARMAASLGAALAMAIATPLFLLRLSPPVAPHWHQLLSIGVMDPGSGAALERLPSGAALWLEEACSDRVALVLHGNNPEGSRQYATGPLRRALLARCFTVASLDHLGYGATPPPAASTALEGWDPLPNILEAKAFISARYPEAKFVLLGHSMGSNDALRVIGGDHQVDTVILLGSALSDPPDRDEYWFSRFVQARGLDDTFQFDAFLEIRESYYDPAASAADLDAGHPPLVFVRFEHEHDNLIAQRDGLFEMLPGRKLAADFEGTTHYFNAAHYRRRVIFADVGSGRRLAHEIERWLAAAADLDPQRVTRAEGP